MRSSTRMCKSRPPEFMNPDQWKSSTAYQTHQNSFQQQQHPPSQYIMPQGTHHTGQQSFMEGQIPQGHSLEMLNAPMMTPVVIEQQPTLGTQIPDSIKHLEELFFNQDFNEDKDKFEGDHFNQDKTNSRQDMESKSKELCSTNVTNSTGGGKVKSIQDTQTAEDDIIRLSELRTITRETKTQG